MITKCLGLFSFLLWNCDILLFQVSPWNLSSGMIWTVLGDWSYSCPQILVWFWLVGTELWWKTPLREGFYLPCTVGQGIPHFPDRIPGWLAWRTFLSKGPRWNCETWIRKCWRFFSKPQPDVSLLVRIRRPTTTATATAPLPSPAPTISITVTNY